MRCWVLTLFYLALCLWSTTLPFKICGFNVQAFGEAKASNTRVMEILIKILARCDLSLIQEVRDSKGVAIPSLVRSLNSSPASPCQRAVTGSKVLQALCLSVVLHQCRTFICSKLMLKFDKSYSYSYLESKRLGKKSYKEQYVYIYRKNVVQLKDHYLYPEPEDGGANDTFSRHPFIVRVHSPATLVKDFVLVGHHTCPKHAMKEIDELYGVFQEISKKWKTQNVMFLGDLNAGCTYITVKGWRSIRLRNDPKFNWLIGDDADTTVREKSHCAYDRIIIHGKVLNSGIVPGSAKPFNFKTEFRLSEEEALEVSDHYPVEVDLKPSHRYFLRNEL